MSTVAEILSGLSRAANGALLVAVAWHVIVAAGLIAMPAGWRPGRRLVQPALALPLVSVSAVSFWVGNPFNGAVFVVLAVALAVLSRRASGRVSGGRWALAGALLIAFAWVYPHFLAGRPWASYLLGAPMGVVPCPTLLLVTGLALILGPGERRGWQWLLVGAGLFYGVVGIVRLGVWLDVSLLFGAGALAAQALGGIRRRRGVGLPRGMVEQALQRG